MPPITVPYLTSLTDSECQRLDLVGGKVQRLAKLAELGLPVPEAFCLTTEAYQAFVVANSLDQMVRLSLNGLNRADPDALRQATEAIRLAFLAADIPSDLVSQIERSYDRLGAGDVAVRSSATSEDLPTSSVAGGHETVLNVRSLAFLHEAIRECWASLWTDRAVLYRQRLGIVEDNVALAVVVQKMVRARVSGVVFTAEPVTGDRQRLIVEACWGLGQLLVSGEVTPDHYEIDRRSWSILCQRHGLQTEMVTAVPKGGTQTVPLPNRLRGRRCLDAGQVLSIAKMAVRIESHFGSPQDIEWGVGDESNSSEEKVYILQARPITTLTREPSVPPLREIRWEGPVQNAIWVRGGGGLVEYLAAPPSPLYATAQLPSICRLHDAHAEQMGTVTPPPTYALINGHYYSRQDYRIRLDAFLLPYRYWRVARTKVRWWREQALPAHLVGLSELSSFDVSTASDEQLLNHLNKLFEFNAATWDAAVWASKSSQFTEPLFRHIFHRFIRPLAGGDVVVFLRGFESPTMAGEQAQWRLVQSALTSLEIAECIRWYPPEEAMERLADLPSARRWLQDFLDYCSTYGHVTARHDYMRPTAADQPAKALASIRIRLDLPVGDPGERLAQMAAERDHATASIMTKLSRHPFRRKLFRWILEWAQEAAVVREDAFFHAFQGWPLARRAILALGNRLVQAGAFSSPEDIFFLTWEEVLRAAACQPAGDWRGRVAERRDAYQWQSLLAPPHWIPRNGPPRTLQRKLKVRLKRFLLGSVDSRDGLLRGAPVSPGVVTGPARVIRSTAEFGRLRSGDILVAPAATPEWMVMFAVAAGLVTDTGGPLSHSSIIAREFGIPAIMGVQGATTSIADGQLITVDGGQGVIRLQ